MIGKKRPARTGYFQQYNNDYTVKSSSSRRPLDNNASYIRKSLDEEYGKSVAVTIGLNTYSITPETMETLTSTR